MKNDLGHLYFLFSEPPIHTLGPFKKVNDESVSSS